MNQRRGKLPTVYQKLLMRGMLLVGAVSSFEFIAEPFHVFGDENGRVVEIGVLEEAGDLRVRGREGGYAATEFREGFPGCGEAAEVGRSREVGCESCYWTQSMLEL